MKLLFLQGLFLLIGISGCHNRNHFVTTEEKERSIVLKNRIISITEYQTIVFLGIRQQEQIRRTKQFDRHGFLLVEREYSPDGNLDRIFKYQYDDAGNLVLMTAVNSNNDFLYKVGRSYDSNDNLKELYFFLPDGNYKYRNIATYDSQGRMTEFAWYWTTGFKSKNVYTYDGKNKITDIEYDSGGNPAYTWKYSYDETNNLLNAIQYSQDNHENRKIQYEYERGLLIKQTEYINEGIQKTVSFIYGLNELPNGITEFNTNGNTTSAIRYEYRFR